MAFAFAVNAQTTVVKYSYDAAGNRTGRVTSSIQEQQTETDSHPVSATKPASEDTAVSVGKNTAKTPEAMPAKEETPADLQHEKQEDRQ